MMASNPAAPDSVASHHYFDRDVGLMAVKLLPSEYYVTSSNTVLSTVLGSCVAACLHDREAGVAGMNHFMLPDDGEAAGTGTRDASESMRYGAATRSLRCAPGIGSNLRPRRTEVHGVD